jgi:hypothetical protein
VAQARSASRLTRARLLALALAIPLLGLAALAGSVAVIHRGAPPPTPIAVATNTPAPTPTSFPPLFPLPDDFTLRAPRAYGSIRVPTATLPSGMGVAITLATSPGGFPAQLPVWRLGAPPLDARAIADRFGISGDAQPLADHGLIEFSAGLSIDPVDAHIAWAPVGVASPRLGGMVRDGDSAVGLAARWLESSGFGSRARASVSVEQTSAGDSAAQPEWQVTWRRAAPGWPGLAIDQTTALVSGDGVLKGAQISGARVSGGSLYPLRTWQDALRDAQANRWYQLCCQPLADFATPGLLHATIRGISLVYAVVAVAGGDLAVPMYAFREGPGRPPGLVPAVAP